MIHSEQCRSEIVVGLVATPPDYPARVAARLTAELAGQLGERVTRTCGGLSGKAGVKWRPAATAALRRCSTILPAGAPTPGGTSRSA